MKNLISITFFSVSRLFPVIMDLATLAEIPNPGMFFHTILACLREEHTMCIYVILMHIISMVEVNHIEDLETSCIVKEGTSI